ncbi:MAG: adenylyltransferase/cytidyltransferase family protein, partial [bacterium]|nr:adenylyltransferase/cytidyltransferase family protein [bacterium]
MQIALFGGSFDPVHAGHQLVVEQVLAHHLFDEVWYVPIGNHDFGKRLSSGQDRVAMLKHVLQDKTKIESFELASPEVSYTHVT